MLAPRARRTFAPRGQTPIQKCWARHGRISAISAVTVSPKRRRLGLYFRLLPENKGAKAVDTISFLKQMRRSLRGPLTICWDRSQIHDRSLLVREWLAKHPEVETAKFPGYAPELNPDEYVWGHTKYAELCNYAAPSLSELGQTVGTTLQHLQSRRDLLQSFINHAHLNWDSP
jgi:transposase